MALANEGCLMAERTYNSLPAWRKMWNCGKMIAFVQLQKYWHWRYVEFIETRNIICFPIVNKNEAMSYLLTTTNGDFINESCEKPT